MSEPHFIRETIQHSIQKNNFYGTEWNQQSLMYGFSGIAAFFSIMDRTFPNEKWDGVAHAYLKLATEAFESKGYSNISLFSGLTGLCAACFVCSNEGHRYKKLNEKLDQILVRELQHFLYNQLNSSLEDEKQPVSPRIYNFVDGLGGIIAYSSIRNDSPHLQSLTSDCIKKLYFILRNKKVSFVEDLNRTFDVPGWYICPNDVLSEEKNMYPKGCYSLSLPYGITGFLSALSIAAMEGFCPKEGYQLIDEIAYWLIDKKGNYQEGHFWPHTISFEDHLNHNLSLELNRDAWCYGIPAVTRALYLAAKASKNQRMQDESEKLFNTMWLKEEKEWNLIGTSFSYGRAGHLAMVTQMARDTGNLITKRKIDDLEERLKNFYKPEHPFGFQSVNFSADGDYLWINDPGIINGAAGIAIALLNIHKPIESMYQHLLMIG